VRLHVLIQFIERGLMRAVAAAEQLGDPTIALVNDECVLRILLGLRPGPASVSRLGKGIPGTTRETISRRLRKLTRAGFVAACDEAGAPIAGRRRAPGDACYILTPLGRVLLDVPAEAIWWETHLPGSVQRMAPSSFGIPGMRALGVLADRTNRLIIRELGDGPLQTAELIARIPGVNRSTVYKRLGDLTGEGLILRTKSAGYVIYELTKEIRELVRVSLRAARCEWLRAIASDQARISDLPGLLHVVAPLAHVPAGLGGIYLLDIESETTLQRRIYLSAASGRVSAMPTASAARPGAVGRGSPEACLEALLWGDPAHIACEGDLVLAQAILQGFSRVLRRPNRPEQSQAPPASN
jgi:DNA-binding HxlR family transcriptional regulator